MEQQLHPYLLDGETVLWSGRTSPFKLRELPFRSALYLLWLISAAAAAMALLFLLPPLLSGQRSLGNTLIILVILLSIPAILSLQPFSDKYKLETSVLYAITNLRAITMVDGQVLSLPLRSSTNASVGQRRGECGTLIIGSNAQWDNRRTLTDAVTGIPHLTEENQIDGLLFFHIPHPDQLLQYFS